MTSRRPTGPTRRQPPDHGERSGRRSPARPPTADATQHRRTTTGQPERRPLALRQEVADYLRIPVKTLAQWAYLGVGPPYQKVGRHTRYRWSDVEQWLDQQCRQQPGGA